MKTTTKPTIFHQEAHIPKEQYQLMNRELRSFTI